MHGEGDGCSRTWCLRRGAWMLQIFGNRRRSGWLRFDAVGRCGRGWD